MNIRSLFGLRAATPVSLILHVEVGEGNSRAALVSFAGPKPKLIFSSAVRDKVQMPLRLTLKPLSFDTVAGPCEEVREFLKQSASHFAYQVDTVHIFLSGPHYSSHTLRVRYHEDKPFALNQQFLERLLKTAGEHRGGDAETPQDSKDRFVISRAVTGVFLNGYPTSPNSAKTASAVEVAVVETSAEQEVVELLRHSVAKFFQAPVSFHASATAALAAARNRPLPQDFLFAFVEKEISELSLVRSQALTDTASLPCGEHSLVRHVARSLKCTPEVALSQLRLRSEGKLAPEEAALFETALLGASAVWTSFFDKALLSVIPEGVAPNTLVVLAPTSLQPLFTPEVFSQSFAGGGLVPGGLKVLFLNEEEFLSAVERLETPDVLLGLEASLLATAGLSSKVYPQEASVPVIQLPVNAIS